MFQSRSRLPALFVAALLSTIAVVTGKPEVASGSVPARGASAAAGPTSASAVRASASRQHCGASPLRAALLIDRSASIGDYDAGGELRRAVAEAAEPVLARGRTSVDAFAERVTRGPAGGSLPGRVGGLVAAGDAGDTDLPRALRTLAARKPVPRLIVVVTDAEPADPVRLPAALKRSTFVFAAIGGAPPAWMVRVANSSGGAALSAGPNDAANVGAAIASAAGCGAAPTGDPSKPVEQPHDPTQTRTPTQPQTPTQVILISGLRDSSREVRGARSAAACAPALSLATWCSVLVADGHRVWVASAAPEGRAGGRPTTLNSTGPLTANGAALARWVDAHVPAKDSLPVYVGHSMGGLIAHAAIGWSGAPGSALVTVGTPHGGSFGADAYLAAKTAARGCRLLCAPTALALRGGAAVVRKRFGDAINDLTRRRRTVVAPLPALPARIAVAAYAGAPNRVPDALTRILRGTGPGASFGRTLDAAGATYLLPNDGIVGVASALADGTRISPGLRIERGSARHSASVLPPGVVTQLASAEVSDFITGAVSRLTGAPLLASRRAGVRPRAGAATTRRTALTRRAAADAEWPRSSPTGRSPRTGAARTKPPRPRRITAPLQAVTPLHEFGAHEPLGDDPAPTGVVISADPLAIDCDGTLVDAVAIDDALYLIDLGVLGCAQVHMGPTGPETTTTTGPRAALVGSDDPDWDRSDGRADLLRRANGTWRLTIHGGAQDPRATCAGANAARSTRITVRRIPATRRAPSVRRYRGTITRKQAKHCARVEVASAAHDGTALAASIELG